MLRAPEVGRCVGDVVLQHAVVGDSITTCGYDYESQAGTLAVHDFLRNSGQKLDLAKLLNWNVKFRCRRGDFF